MKTPTEDTPVSERKWTKGPWTVRDNGPHWNNPAVTNYNIAWSEDGELVAEHVYEQADAHLIAAAPDLYEALTDLLSAYEDPGNEGHTHDDKVAKARAALQRAEGE